MTKLDAFEDLKDAWSEFCCLALAETGTSGIFKGDAKILLISLADFLFDKIEDTIDLTEEANR